jgi:hypothetical protein
MKPASSQASSIAAALKSFGLVEYQGSGDDLKVVLSEDGRTYLRAQQEEIKRAVLRRVALKPTAIAKYWSEWGVGRPPDPVCLDELVFKAKFSQPGAEAFLKVYDATIAYSGLSEATSGDELVDERRADGDSSKFDGATSPESKAEPVAGGLRFLKSIKRGADVRQDVFNLDEGEVLLQYPAKMSADSFEDFESWINLQLKKIKRSIDKQSNPSEEIGSKPEHHEG